MLKQSDLKVSYKPYNEDDASMVRIGLGAQKRRKELNFTYSYNLEQGLLVTRWRNQGGI